MHMIRPLQAAAFLSLAGLAACTTTPRHSGLLSDYSRLSAIEGRQTKHAENRPATPPVENQPLFIEIVDFAPDVEAAAKLPDKESQLVLNQFSRKLCTGLSKRFAIASEPSPQAYRLKAHVTELRPTSRAAAAISTPLDLASPVGARLPVGLGAFGAEIEMLGPDGQQVAALVWRRDADFTSTGASISRINDAYDLAGDAASDFSELFEAKDAKRAATRIATGLVPDVGLKRGDDACQVYGRAQDALRTAAGFLPTPKMPPEWTDKGAQQPKN